MTAQDTIPEDIMQAANAVIASAQSLITIDTIEQAMDGHMAIRDVYATEIAKAILAERERCVRVSELYSAFGWRGSEITDAIRNGSDPSARKGGEA